MTGRSSIHGTLNNAEIRQVAFLTLALVLILISRLSHAETVQAPDSLETKRRIGEVETYIRNEGLHGMSLLPSNVRDIAGWFSGWHQVHLSDDSDAGDEKAEIQSLVSSSPSVNGLSFPIATSIHHKGFLPTHDAMMMGVGANKNFLNDKLQLTARPFYGQSWNSLRGYWGGELALDVARHPDDMPWGKISIGYISGDESMTDHGRGVDLHGDIDLTNHFTLTSGVRQNSISGNANYGMIQWKLSFGGNP